MGMGDGGWKLATLASFVDKEIERSKYLSPSLFPIPLFD